MKTIKTFNNASVLSVEDGRITLRVGDNEIRVFNDSSIVSIVDGEVKISLKDIFTDDMLEPGMVVEYNSGSRRLVLKIGGCLMFCGRDSWRNASMVTGHTLGLDVAKVYHPQNARTIDDLLNRPDNLIWSK